MTNNICIPYQYLKSTIYEKRIDIFEMNLLRGELIDLERNINTGKVDHPVGGSKDTADALCGSVYNASLAAEEYAFEYGENMNTAADFNVDVDPLSDYINNFEESIKQSHNTQTDYHEGPQEVFIPSSDILFW